MQVRLFYIGVLSIMLGVGVRSLVDVPDMYLAALALGGFVAALYSRVSFATGVSISVALMLFVCGVVRMDFAVAALSHELVSSVEDQIVVLEGVIVREPEQREHTVHIYVAAETLNGQDVESSSRVLLYADRSMVLAYGDRISAEGEMSTPESFTTDLSRTFNYPDYLKARGVSQVMFYPDITPGVVNEGNIFFTSLLNFKQYFITRLEQVLPEPQVGLGKGLLLGEKSGLGESWEEVFRRTGIIHIVVLSGYNVMLVVVFVMTVLSYVLGIRGRLWAGLLAIFCFAFLVGFSATVVRASIMAALLLVAQSTGRTYAIIRALCLAAVLMVLWNPYILLFDPGFQLSFLATLGLLTLAPALEEWLAKVPNVFSARSFLVATLATQIFVLPFLLYQIGEVSVVSVLVNVLVLPMVPAAMLLTFVTGIVAMVSTTGGQLVGLLAYWSLAYILRVAELFSQASFASYAVPPFHIAWMIAGYGGLGLLVIYLHRHYAIPKHPAE